MKIAFHIPRMNWYRVLSPLIDVALERGHEVECWHHASAYWLEENCPNHEKLPQFQHGVPRVIDYDEQGDILGLIQDRCPAMIVDLFPPKVAGVNDLKRKNNGFPLWVLVDLPPSDSFIAIQSDEALYTCDMFVICNEFYFDSIIKYSGQDKNELLSSVKEQAKVIGQEGVDWVENNYMYRFGEEQIQYLRDNAVLVGNAGFDQYPRIDKVTVRKKHNIPPDKKVIVLLPFAFGYDRTAPWEQLYGQDSVIRRLLWLVSTKRFDCTGQVFSALSNATVLKALRHFTDYNDALLIAKLRHSRHPASELRRNCHLLIGEQGYYPHTAAELFAAADLVVGHYSSGATEAIALGTPYLNIEIPGFPETFFGDTRASLECCKPWPGALWSLSAHQAVKELPSQSLEEFRLQPAAREKYIERFASWPLGEASVKILRHLESRVEMTDRTNSPPVIGTHADPGRAALLSLQ